MKEVVYDFEEFKAKVDSSKPIHHSCWHKAVDEYGIIHEVEFKVYGISKDGNLLIFEFRDKVDLIKGDKKFGDKLKEVYEKLVEKFAKPLGSTEGRWEL